MFGTNLNPNTPLDRATAITRGYEDVQQLQNQVSEWSSKLERDEYGRCLSPQEDHDLVLDAQNLVSQTYAFLRSLVNGNEN